MALSQGEKDYPYEGSATTEIISLYYCELKFPLSICGYTFLIATCFLLTLLLILFQGDPGRAGLPGERGEKGDAGIGVAIPGPPGNIMLHSFPAF